MRYLLILLTIAGCATAGGYKKSMDSWVGSSVDDLVGSWGAPDKSYETKGAKYIEYVRRQPSSITNSYGYTHDLSTQCRTTFIVKEDKIVDYGFEGSLCRN